MHVLAVSCYESLSDDSGHFGVNSTDDWVPHHSGNSERRNLTAAERLSTRVLNSLRHQHLVKASVPSNLVLSLIAFRFLIIS